ncbi:hypothetical protein ACF082_34565 [Streptomyces lydicus]|uniref:hypothetical protein n=1 Tax=Streptomyces lydicus TaxID=47763 RepID=UPI0036FC46CE
MLWGEWTPERYAHTAGQNAFAHGAAECADTVTTHCPDGVIELYDRGRGEAHRVTLRRDEP